MWGLYIADSSKNLLISEWLPSQMTLVTIEFLHSSFRNIGKLNVGHRKITANFSTFLCRRTNVKTETVQSVTNSEVPSWLVI